MKYNANDPSLESWINVQKDSDFPIQNLPFGIFSTDYLSKGVGVAIGDCIVDLTYLQENGFLDGLGLPEGVFNSSQLNSFFALGRKTVGLVRNEISQLLDKRNMLLQKDAIAREMAIVDRKDAVMHMPVKVPNYTDLYSSIEHATNVGKMFRDPENALLPNWKHIPVGYHGRASSIVISGTPIKRPNGQTKAPDQENPVFGPSKRLDFELEMAFITSSNTTLGEPITVGHAEEHIVGVVLFNDWSARDIQVWEYVPLGPFLGKNFGSSISPWVVTLDALEPFRVSGPEHDVPVLPYLQTEKPGNFDINLEVFIKPEGGDPSKVCTSNSKYLYWSMAQQLAHHTVNGCNVEVGDLYASGTISGSTPDSFGSMLELAWKGTKPLTLSNGESRIFINNNDTVIMRGFALNEGYRIGFGEVSNQIIP